MGKLFQKWVSGFIDLVTFSNFQSSVVRFHKILDFLIRPRKLAGKMASQSQGIQQLLAAEKRAAEKVAEARKRKNFVLYLNFPWSPTLKLYFHPFFQTRKTTSTKTGEGRSP